ncbi:hypothetical protein ACFSM5_14685 [Lacibacterium aquatile]|uniref:Uncharacterized protein n=1 Tax=Lacibacterium aquatile TaxID=1168082 RepID=A0ABW5DY30_9PROT
MLLRLVPLCLLLCLGLTACGAMDGKVDEKTLSADGDDDMPGLFSKQKGKLSFTLR